jgi:hypothetical protein
VVLLILSFSPLHAQTTALISFNEPEFAPFREKRTASITGRIFLVTRDNHVIVQSSGPVILIPAIPSTKEWFKEFVIEGECRTAVRKPSETPNVSYLVNPRICRLPFIMALDEKIHLT